MTDFASCCLLSYNRPEFVREAITTLMGNAGYPLELIVHDDGSDDPAVQEVLRHFVDSGTISTLIENPPGHNQGVGNAVRRMFGMASGDPLIKIDQDLIFSPNWLRTTVEVLARNRQGWRADNALERRIGALGLFKYHTKPVHHAEMFRKRWGAWDEVEDFVGSALVVEREIYDLCGPFPTHSDAFAEDVEFKTRVKEMGLALGLTHEDLAVNRGFGVGPSTVVAGWDDEKDEGIVQKINKGPRIVEFTR